MRMPEMPLEPVKRDGSFGFAQDDRPEDEDRIHELVKRADEYIREKNVPIKPCPFCGKIPTINRPEMFEVTSIINDFSEAIELQKTWRTIRCETGGCPANNEWIYTSEENAAKYWNRREADNG